MATVESFVTAISWERHIEEAEEAVYELYDTGSLFDSHPDYPDYSKLYVLLNRLMTHGYNKGVASNGNY